MHPQRLEKIKATARQAGWTHPDYLELIMAVEKQSAEIKRLRDMVQGLADRVAAQSELLSRRAEGKP